MTEALLQRMRENAKQNLPVFTGAGMQQNRVRNVRCPCGCADRAYFWTLQRHGSLEPEFNLGEHASGAGGPPTPGGRAGSGDRQGTAEIRKALA